MDGLQVKALGPQPVSRQGGTQGGSESSKGKAAIDVLEQCEGRKVTSCQQPASLPASLVQGRLSAAIQSSLHVTVKP